MSNSKAISSMSASPSCWLRLDSPELASNPLIFFQNPRFKCDEKYNLDTFLKYSGHEIVPQTSPEEELNKWLKSKIGEAGKDQRPVTRSRAAQKVAAEAFLATDFEFLCKYNLYQGFKKHGLEPFTASLNIKPDCAVVKKDGLLVLSLEVHSSPYNNTVAKAVANTIDQLRLFRSYSDDFKVSSFVFPKLAQMDSEGKVVNNNKTCVTKVDIEWKDMVFCVSFECLAMEEVWGCIKKAFLRQQKCAINDPIEDGCRYFMRLSHEDLANLESKLESKHKLIQLKSRFSIIVAEDADDSGSKVFKMVPNSEWRHSLHVLFFEYRRKSRSYPHLSVPIDVVVISHRETFFVFKRHLKPLSRSEAKPCLVDLTERVRQALEEVHDLGFAHLDVRLSNICYTRNGDVQLIDFDRIQPTKDPPPVVYGDAFMYTGSDTSSGLDWKQLGIMIYMIQEEMMGTSEAKIEEKDVNVSKDSFLGKLIFQCEYNADEFQQWKTTRLQTVSLIDVINQRLTN